MVSIYSSVNLGIQSPVSLTPNSVQEHEQRKLRAKSTETRKATKDSDIEYKICERTGCL